MKLKGIILAVILSLASIMMPFNLYADTISASNIVGVNVQLVGSTELEHRIITVSPDSYNYYYKQYTYKAVIELDNSYVGVIGARVQGSYYDRTPDPSAQIRTESLNHYRKIYVNGNTAEMTFVVSSWYNSADDPIIYRADGTSPYVTIEDSNVTKYEDIDSIEQIIDLLSDIYQNSNDIEGLSTNQLSELQDIVANTSLANDYLEIISSFRQWNIPFESYIVVSSAIFNNLQLLQDTYGYQYFNYPIYLVKTNDRYLRYNIPSNNKYTWILYSSLNLSKNNIKNNIGFSLDVTIDSVTKLYNGQLYTNTSNGFFYKVDFTTNETGYLDITSLTNNNRYIPIFIGSSDNQYMSTDFALQFGLSNQLLNDLHIIANGTNQSNQAASDLESGNDQMADDMDDLANIENGYNQQFNNQLQQIDFSSPLQNNAGILPAANFVITIFNGLINNNPFSVLIIIVCILLIGKKVIGK